jgi:hypothetical protein
MNGDTARWRQMRTVARIRWATRWMRPDKANFLRVMAAWHAWCAAASAAPVRYPVLRSL